MASDIPHGPIWYGATVLVVDNEPAMRALIQRRLEGEGFHVEVARDGEAALALIQRTTSIMRGGTRSLGPPI